MSNACTYMQHIFKNITEMAVFKYVTNIFPNTQINNTCMPIKSCSYMSKACLICCIYNICVYT